MRDRAAKPNRSEMAAEVVSLRGLAAVRPLPAGERMRRERAYGDAVMRLVASNEGLVHKVAYKYSLRCRHLELEDLVQEGNLGLLRAIQKYDPSLGYAFSTYAIRWVVSFIARAGRKDPTIRRPDNFTVERRKMDRAAEQSRRSTGEDATPEQIAELSGATKKRVNRIREVSIVDTTSLDEPIRIGGSAFGRDITLLDTIPDESPTPEDKAAESVRDRTIQRILACLTPIQRTVIRGRFFDESTLEGVAKTLPKRLSRERIRAIEGVALKKMRAMCKGLKLELSDLLVP